MNIPSPHHLSARAEPSFARRAWPVAVAGALGLLSLLLQPVPAVLLERLPALAALPPLVQRAVLLGNPLLLLLAAVLVGAALAHRVGLRSVLAGTAAAAGLPRTLWRAAAAGLVLGLALAGVDAAIAPQLGPRWQQLAAAGGSGAALAVGLLYGGVAEEVMLRWGAMSLLAWVLLRVAGPRRHAMAMALAAVLAAALFGAAHLPALAAQVEPTPALVARTLLLNGAAGLLYGWLYWRRHLEAAMAAHAATHLGMAAWRALPV